MFPVTMPKSFLPLREPEPPALLAKVHMPFQSWLFRAVRNGTLHPAEKFSIIEKQAEYTLQCWRDEILWEKWRKNVSEE